MDDKVAKRRQTIGSQIKSSKLKKADVYFIRFRSGETHKALAEMFGLGKDTFAKIRQGKLWKHVTVDNE